MQPCKRAADVFRVEEEEKADGGVVRLEIVAGLNVFETIDLEEFGILFFKERREREEKKIKIITLSFKRSSIFLEIRRIKTNHN
jgi:hypothetical protein